MSESRPKQPARILVFHARKGGLANRLRALVGYRALSRCLGVRFGLAWEVNDWCEAPFEALFRADGVELVAPEALTELAPGDGAEVHEARSWFDAVWETCGRGRVEWSDYIAEVGRCLAELTPVAEIAAQVDRFLEANRPWPRVGVHIRHTDNLQKYEGWTKQRQGVFKPGWISTLEGFAAALDRRAAAGPFFLATDSADVELILVRSYPDAVVSLPKQYRSPSGRSPRTSSAQAALVELLLLARCPEIIGTYYSSYSKFAAIVGGADYYEIHARRCERNPSVERMQLALGTNRLPVPSERRVAIEQAPSL